MAKVIRSLCDIHLGGGQEVEGTHTTIVVDGVEFEIELCGECSTTHVTPILTMLGEYGRATVKRGRPASLKQQCKECGVIFESRDKLREHRLETHGGAHTCADEDCGRKFGTAQGLHMHMTRAHGATPRSRLEKSASKRSPAVKTKKAA